MVRRLRQQTSVQGLLDEGTRALRAMLGFDRVLTYHFKRDGSSQVVAEASSAADWPPRLGRRFPEAHIPAEARRLFSLNPARHVPDADSAPVPLEAAPGHDAPLDMTLSALRSVPDFHAHYLHDSGISASMCVPLIVDGDLWGILACHHRAAVQVPYPVRASCAVLGELLSTQLQYQLAKDRAARELTHERLRGNLLAQLQGATDPALVLASRLPNMARAFGAQAAVLSHQSSVFAHGDIPHGLQTALLRWLHDGGVDSGRVYVTDALTESAPDLAAQLTGWGGMMSFCFDEPSQTRIVLLRRLTPGASDGDASSSRARGALGETTTGPDSDFDGTVAWGAVERDALQALGNSLGLLVGAGVADMHRYRNAVGAMLRAQAREVALPESSDQTSRFDRVLHKAMELSLMRGNVKPLALAPVDLPALLSARVTQALQREHGASIYLDTPAKRGDAAPVAVQADHERLAALFDGLIDNALRHGQAGESVVVRVRREGDSAVTEISNISPPIVPAVVDMLFSGTEPAAVDDSRGGLGFGLYVCQSIAQAHGGSLAYTHEDPFVTLSVRLPLAPAPAH